MNSKIAQFEQYLSEYQEDLVKIIGKHRRNYHQLSAEEIASEANLLLIKGRDKIIKSLGNDFNQNSFKRMAYAYVKNAISWSNHKELNNKAGKMRKKIVDLVHEGEDGPITTFDLALQKAGEEDCAEIFSNSDALKNFIHVLVKYYYLLTDNEVKILSYMQKGMNQYDMAEKTGVTRQAISHAILGLKEKIQSQFDFEDIYHEKKIGGQSALEDFLKSDKVLISEKEKEFIISFVKANPKRYTCKELNEKLFKKKFKDNQIVGFVRSKNLFHLVRKSRPGSI